MEKRYKKQFSLKERKLSVEKDLERILKTLQNGDIDSFTFNEVRILKLTVDQISEEINHIQQMLELLKKGI